MDINVQSFAVANLRRRPHALETGGFVAGFDPATSSPYINYATPHPGARPTRDDVRALVAAFRERGLVPRLEFAPDAAPAVEAALRDAGFTVEETHPYLVCTPATLIPPHRDGRHPAVPVETPSCDEEYAAVDAAQAESFGGSSPRPPKGPPGSGARRRAAGASASSGRPTGAARAPPPAPHPPSAPRNSPVSPPAPPTGAGASPERSPPR